MSSTTPTLGLILYDSTTDQAVNFATFRAVWGGTATSSNFYKIDTAIGTINSQITNLQNTRGSIPVNAEFVSANYYEATVASITSLITGMTIILDIDTISDGTVTLQINALGIKSLMKANSSGTFINLTGSDLVPGRRYLFEYDGTRWIWVSANSADQIQIVGTTGNVVTVGSTNNLDGSTTPSSLIGSSIHAATEKTTPANDDEIGLLDSAASYVLKRIKWSSFRAALGLNVLSSASPRVYTSNATWTKPSGLSYIIVEVLGGGGGGGGTTGDTGKSAASSGGGSGGYSKKKIMAASLSSTETVTVGAGGTGATAGANDGSAGGNSSFGSHCTGGGGGGGKFMNAGTTALGATGGSGGTATGGDINITGYSAQRALRFSDSIFLLVRGADSLFGGATEEQAANADGADATAFGAGGNGSKTSNVATPRAGGDGAPGIVIVWEYGTF